MGLQAHTSENSGRISPIQDDERQSVLIERERDAGTATHPVKCPVVLKDEAHVLHKVLHLAVPLPNQLFPDFV